MELTLFVHKIRTMYGINIVRHYIQNNILCFTV